MPRSWSTERSPDGRTLLRAETRGQWRAWLLEHYRSEPEIWLVYHKKHTGRPRVSYNDAVEEALCFGWIDSTVKTIDADRYSQRFTPRNSKSPYSQANKERLRALVRQGMVAAEVLATLGDVLEEEPVVIPPDILEALRVDDAAWENFQGFSPAYVRIRIAFIEAARARPPELEKRLRYFVRMTHRNTQYGFGGIERHY